MPGGGDRHGRVARAVGWCVAWALGACLAAGAAAQTDPPLRLRIVGGLAGVNQYVNHEQPFWARELPRLSGGRITAEIVPFDQAGIRSQEMLRVMQLGTVPFGTALLSRIQTVDAELSTADLAGLNPDMASLRRHMGAFRPHLERIMRERHGIEVLAVYVYPAQVTFCTRPFNGLSDLAGRRVRTGSPSQADLMRALGAIPVQTEFAEIVSAVKSGVVECAVTGAMSGNTIGLHEVTHHLDPKAVSWGLSIFGANLGAWNALPAHARKLMRDELPKLEQAIWAESDRDTSEGVACNTGGACTSGRKGRMTEVKASAADAQRVRQIFTGTVLPAWLRRCGPACVALWNQSMAPVVGLEARPQ